MECKLSAGPTHKQVTPCRRVTGHGLQDSYKFLIHMAESKKLCFFTNFLLSYKIFI
jgi:hypothetical protein